MTVLYWRVSFCSLWASKLFAQMVWASPDLIDGILPHLVVGAFWRHSIARRSGEAEGTARYGYFA